MTALRRATSPALVIVLALATIAGTPSTAAAGDEREVGTEAELRHALATCAHGVVVGDLELSGAALDVRCTVELRLDGHLRAPGVTIAPGTRLTIAQESTGRLTTTGAPNRAGIRTAGAELVLRGGSVVAIGRGDGAGVGGGGGQSGGTVTVSGGDLDATGGLFAAGIGGGAYADGGTLQVSGGTVTAQGGAQAAGIGGGQNGSGGSVTVTGGLVTASGSLLGSGIGGGDRGAGGNVTISGGAVVRASATTDSAAVGGGSRGDAGRLTIGHGAALRTTGGYTAVGSGAHSDGRGSMTVDGILELSSSHLRTAGMTITVGATGSLRSTEAAGTPGSTIVGPGLVTNHGSITLPTGRVLTAPPVTVTQNHREISFDSHGGEPVAPVRVFAASFDEGDRLLPTPTRAGWTFAGWWTTADGGGTAVTPDTPLVGHSSTGSPVRHTLHARWTQAPVLTGEPTVSGIAGQEVTWTPASLTGAPAPIVSVTDGYLPDGLTLDEDTGVISGIPTMAGSTSVELTATNGIGADATHDLTIEVRDVISGLSPTVTGTPREGRVLTADPGDVSPSSTTLTYQWKADGTVLAGATRSSLALTKAHAGRRISVAVTATLDETTTSSTSKSTGIVSSPHRRLVVTGATTRGEPFTVTATGLRPGQKYNVLLSGTRRATGTVDRDGTATATVTFHSATKPGQRRVRVSGYTKRGTRDYTVHELVAYR